jgi:hypothetical protein
MLIEQMNCLGGMSTAGGLNVYALYTDWGNQNRVIGGIAWEMVQRTLARGVGDYGRGVFTFGNALPILLAFLLILGGIVLGRRRR